MIIAQFNVVWMLKTKIKELRSIKYLYIKMVFFFSICVNILSILKFRECKNKNDARIKIQLKFHFVKNII